MRLQLQGVEVRWGTCAEACECTIENSSAYVLTVITVVESRTLALVSAYVADLNARAAVTHMRLLPRQRASFDQRELGPLPGASHPRACLLDHVAELRALLETVIGEPVTVEVPETALEQASAVWRPSPGR